MLMILMMMLIGGHVWRAVYRLRLPRPLVIDHLRRADGLNKAMYVYIFCHVLTTRMLSQSCNGSHGATRMALAPGGHFAIQAHCVALTACWQARQPFAGQWRVLRPLE